MARIGIILGSTRPTRISPVVGAWAQERLAALGNHTYEMIDLTEQNLPFFDEPASPKSGVPYQHQHTRDWSELISGFDGFVVALPEYNGGLPAVNIKLSRAMFDAEGKISDAATAFAEYEQALLLLDEALGEALA